MTGYCSTRVQAGAIAMMCLLAGAAAAAPQFTEVTRSAGIEHAGPTAGASWGDLDGDGWPDLWIGTHRFGETAPVLLLNQRNGTFRDVSRQVTVDPEADLHGAAWADYDRDGDQDLVVLAGGGAGQGSSPNLLLRNDAGVLTDIASEVGLALPVGRGRTPVWLDADNDGILDLLISNKPRPDGQAPTTLYVQDHGRFRPTRPPLVFAPAPRSWFDDLVYRMRHGFSLRTENFGALGTLEVFAQLADVDGDRRMDLLAYDSPTRIYGLGSPHPRDLSNDVYLGTEHNISDIAIEDFDGDQRFDLYLTRARAGTADVVQTGPHALKAVFRGSQGAVPNSLRFVAPSRLELQLVDPWEVADRMPPIRIGASGRQPDSGSFELDPNDPEVAGPAERSGAGDEILITYDPASSTWTIANWGRPLQAVIEALEAPISQIETVGFIQAKGAMADRLLLGRSGDFERQPRGTDDAGPDACTSAAAGDFDNDMDVDVYLVCAEPVQNAANVLLENLGKGRFTRVADAGGAAGSRLGRGDSVATADYDRDGFLDLFVTNGEGAPPFSDDGPYQLFRNRGNGNHWLEIDLVGTRSNPDAIGAVVQVTAGAVDQIRQQSGGMHRFSQNHARLHFGLADHARVERLQIWWPSGQQQEIKDVQADRIITVREP